MFFKKRKKQENKVSFTPLYVRISSLYNCINTNKCNIYTAAKTNSFHASELGNNKSFKFTFNSNNGPIDFTIKAAEDDLEFKQYTIVYINQQTRWMFEIYCGPNFTVVAPDLGKTIMASDIDLALFEIENFVEDVVVENIANYRAHNSELQKLENLDFKA